MKIIITEEQYKLIKEEFGRDWIDDEYADEYPKYKDMLINAIKMDIKAWGEDDTSILMAEDGNKVIIDYRKKSKRSIEIVLDNETLNIDLINNIITNDNGELLFFNNDFDIQETYNSQLEYFISSLNNNLKPMNTIQESIQILKLILNDK